MLRRRCRFFVLLNMQLAASNYTNCHAKPHTNASSIAPTPVPAKTSTVSCDSMATHGILFPFSIRLIYFGSLLFATKMPPNRLQNVASHFILRIVLARFSFFHS